MKTRARKRVLVASDAGIMGQVGLKGIQQYVLTHPYLRLRLCMSDPAMPGEAARMRRMLTHFRANGVLSLVTWERPKRMPWRDVPMVNASDAIALDCPTVNVDQQAAGRLAAEHLLQQGLEHFAFVAVTGRGYGSKLRWRGFRDRLREAGHTCHLYDDFVPKERRAVLADEDICAWVRQLPRPVGIHAVYLHLGLRVLWACSELRLKVPDEVAVIGGQDQPGIAASYDPTVSAIEFGLSRLGYEGLRLLDDLMHGGQPPFGPLLLPPVGVVVRQSSDRRGARDPAVAQAREYIRVNADRPFVIKALLAHNVLARRALERRFRRNLGCSLHDEIVAQRMERAKGLLQQTALPVTQIAKQSGYARYPVFAVAFRRHTGLTATAWRRQAVAPTSPACQ